MNAPAETKDVLLDGAMEEFARHGFARTSMSDIARAAGVSRTSLYNHFPNKEDVFKALSERINDSVYRAVVTNARDEAPWDARLLAVINARVGWVYDLLHASAYGRELINEKNRICGGAVLAANDKFARLVADILSEPLPDRRERAAHAEVLIQSLNGVLETAETETDAKRKVSLLVDLFCKGVAKT